MTDSSRISARNATGAPCEQRRSWKRPAAAVVFGFVLSVLLMEAALRIGIALEIPRIRSPELFGDYDSDDVFWLLHHRWIGRFEPCPKEHEHPLLGWSQTRATADNPLGLQESTISRLVDDGRCKILFYGDSFVKGVAAEEHHIPRLMERGLVSCDVLDLGVGGFGTDQIYLMFKATYRLVSQPLIVVGVLTQDLDRAALTVRTSYKPYFTLGSGGELSLHGVPVSPRDQDRLYHAAIGSYLLHLMAHRLKIGDEHELQQKRVLNTRFFEDIRDRCLDRGLDLMFVLFYGEEELETTLWREAFLEDVLSGLGIPYLDTKALLVDYARRHGLERRALYVQTGPGSGHHHNLGNRIIAEGLVRVTRPILDRERDDGTGGTSAEKPRWDKRAGINLAMQRCAPELASAFAPSGPGGASGGVPLFAVLARMNRRVVVESPSFLPSEGGGSSSRAALPTASESRGQEAEGFAVP